MKNDNVLIDAQMNFKICDFGIAQLLDDGKDGM
jgi:serine/threonine protein kinase